MDERRLNNLRHQLVLAERERLTLDGVIHVESFDDREIVLDTELGGAWLFRARNCILKS